MQPLLIVISAAALLIGVLWAWQVRTPRRVPWRAGSCTGGPAQIAEGLVLQHDDGRTVWATRGFSIYRSIDGAAFDRVARIRPPLGEPWGGYLSWLRRRYGYQELVEVLPLPGDEQLVVFAAGWIHRVDLPSGAVRRVQQLRYFGRGRGRGLMAFGLDRAPDGALYFAEYVTESGTRPTGVWCSGDDGESWQLAFEFDSGMVRHIHTVHVDEVDASVWIGTGDRDEHCFIGRSTDDAHSFSWVAQGAQPFRTCAFVGLADCVLWAMDADFEQNHVLVRQRAGGEIVTGAELPDATYYAARVDERRALLGLAQSVAEVWVAHADASAVAWLSWPCASTPPLRGPSPGVRLARGDFSAGSVVHVNPLRTSRHEAAIYRIDRAQVPA